MRIVGFIHDYRGIQNITKHLGVVVWRASPPIGAEASQTVYPVV